MFFADLWHFAGWVGKRVDRRKVRTEKNPSGRESGFSVRGIGGSQEKDGQRETFGGQREVKIFYSEQQGSWRIFGACGGRQGGEGFLAGKLNLRDETFRRQENRRVCSGRREELFQQLGAESEELFLPAGVKLGCGEKGKGSLQMERGGLREENAAGAIPAVGSAGGSGAFSPGGRPGPGSWRGGQRSLLE